MAAGRGRRKLGRIARPSCAMLVAAAVAAAVATPAQARAERNLTKYVNPFSGTAAGAPDFGTGGGAGNTYPGATAPFGMLNWSPDSTPSVVNSPGGYSYVDTKLRGFSLTHLSGAGCPVYQDIPILPTTTAVNRSPVAALSTEWQPEFVPSFSHADESAHPGYYRVRLNPNTPEAIQSQLTANTRSGLGRFRFPATPHASMLINTGGSGFANTAADVRIDPARREVTGSASGGQFCLNRNSYRVYFAARFDRPFSEFGTWRRQQLRPGTTSSSDSSPVAVNYEPNPYGPGSIPGDPSSTAQAGAYLTFDTRHRRAVEVKVAVSYVSADAARRNLEAESSGWDLAASRRAGRSEWNRMLRRAQVSGGTRPLRRTYYTALYHSLLAPRTFSDVDGRYRGMNGDLHQASNGGVQYADFSGWDIYRTEIPLLSMLAPGRAGEMVQSLINGARENGCLPKWPVANGQTNAMVGDPADLIIAGADAFGAGRFDHRAALAAMLRGANQLCLTTEAGAYVQRQGLAEYLRLGYVPLESNSPLGNVTTALNPAGVWGSAATTLEYTAADFAIAQLARRMGDRATAAIFRRRSGNWRKLFNPASGYIEQRSLTGHFSSGYDPASDDGFVEGSGGQYTWAVPYDVSGLVDAIGGRDAATARLDAFFAEINAGPTSNHAYLGNEPTLGTPWLYAWLGQPAKTQRIVREALLGLYDGSPSGYPGNDDLGTMSAWYVLAALGIYPAIPATDTLALHAPLFPRAHLRIAGKDLRIKADGATAQTPFVRGLKLRRRQWDRPWLRWRNLARGGTAEFDLAPKPAGNWGERAAAAPPSFPPG